MIGDNNNILHWNMISTVTSTSPRAEFLEGQAIDTHQTTAAEKPQGKHEDHNVGKGTVEPAKTAESNAGERTAENTTRNTNIRSMDWS